MIRHEEIPVIDEVNRTNFEAIKMALVGDIQSRMDEVYEDVRVFTKPILKTNGLEKTAIIIDTPEEKVTPTVYVDELIALIQQDEMSVKEATEAYMDIYIKHEQQKPSYESEFDEINYTNAKEKVFSEAINTANNKELLEGVPHIDMGEVSIVARYRVGENATFLIKNEHAEVLGMEADEIMETAIYNTCNRDGMHVEPMIDMLSDIVGVPREELEEEVENPSLYVCTNEGKVLGASGMFVSPKLREEVCEKIGRPYAVIGSSIHECICLPAELEDLDELQEMITEVNMTNVSEDERLSDMPFYVDASLQIKSLKELRHLSEMQEEAPVIARGIHM